MVALVTGASSGIGRDIARSLVKRGIKVIITGRNKEKLTALRDELGRNMTAAIVCDLSKEKTCFALYEKLRDKNIDILVNCAGFGKFGAFLDVPLEQELDEINVNIKAVHILTKLFLRDFAKRDSGYILNVASSAGFMPGPLFSTYYASKSYVVRLTHAIYEELRRMDSDVYVGVLCPGPVDTEFNKVAGVDFAISGMSSEYVAEYAVRKMFERKLTIIPGRLMQFCIPAVRFVPEKQLLRIVYHVQHSRLDKSTD